MHALHCLLMDAKFHIAMMRITINQMNASCKIEIELVAEKRF